MTTQLNDVELDILAEFIVLVMAHDPEVSQEVIADNPSGTSVIEMVQYIIDRLPEEYNREYFISRAIEEIKSRFPHNGTHEE